MSDRDQLDIVVNLLSISGQAKVCRLGANCLTDDLNLKRAHHFFADSRLNVTLRIEDEQQTFEQMEHVFNGVVDVKGYRTDATNYKFSLAFAVEEVDINELWPFRNKRARLVGVRTGKASAEAEASADDDADDDVSLYEEQDDGDWREQPIDVLRKHGVAAGTLKTFQDHEPSIITLGSLSDAMGNGNTWYDRIRGLGKGKAEKVQDALTAWFAANPDKCPPVKAAAETNADAEESQVLDATGAAA